MARCITNLRPSNGARAVAIERIADRRWSARARDCDDGAADGNGRNHNGRSARVDGFETFSARPRAAVGARVGRAPKRGIDRRGAVQRDRYDAPRARRGDRIERRERGPARDDRRDGVGVEVPKVAGARGVDMEIAAEIREADLRAGEDDARRICEVRRQENIIDVACVSDARLRVASARLRRDDRDRSGLPGDCAEVGVVVRLELEDVGAVGRRAKVLLAMREEDGGDAVVVAEGAEQRAKLRGFGDAAGVARDRAALLMPSMPCPFWPTAVWAVLTPGMSDESRDAIGACGVWFIALEGQSVP
ncbi:hypothetical protein OUZ56_032625, partial [Daphnia magna]